MPTAFVRAGAADVFTVPERERIEALWRLTALPRAEFDATYLAMLGEFWRRAAGAAAWTYVRDERPWAGEGAPAAWYRFFVDRKAHHPMEHLAGFAGWMHADGYAGFERLIRAGPIREVACMAYVAVVIMLRRAGIVAPDMRIPIFSAT